MNMMLSVFHWICEASLRASLLTLAVVLLQAALRNVVSARWRYALWLPVLAVLTLPVLPRSRWSAENLFNRIRHAQAQVLPAAPVEVAEDASPAAPVSVSVLDWRMQAAGIVWAAGVMLSLGGGLVSYMGALRRLMAGAEEPGDSLKRMIGSLGGELGLRRLPRAILSRGVESPAVTGLLRPVLLLPADFATAFGAREGRLVLKHELMHLKRFDLETNALVSLLNALHWFNPVLWLATWRLRQDREAACDAQVLASEPGDCRGDYGDVLLKVQSGYCSRWMSIGFVGIFEPGRALRGRIEAIARYRRPSPLGGVAAAAVIALMGVLGATHAQTDQPAPAAAPGATTEVPGLDAGKNGLVTRLWLVGSGFIGAHAAAVDFLTGKGVPFPPGASAVYFPSTHRLVVHNTPANIQLVDAIIAKAGAQLSADDALSIWPPTKPIRAKLSRIIIPRADFHEATLREVVDVLKQKSFDLDTSETNSAKRGVNIVLKLDTVSAPGATPADPGNGARITCSLINIPLIEALKYVCQLTNLKLKIDPYAVEIVSPASTSEFITKEYKVTAGFGGSQTAMDFLTGQGVPFPAGASAAYFPSWSRLVVHNTESNIELVDAVVESTWPRGKGAHEAPPALSAPADSPAPGTVQAKLNGIIIPDIEFRDATVRECVDFLSQKSRELDTAGADPSRRGVNIVLKGDPGGRITLSLTKIPLIEAIKYIAQLSNLKVAVDGDVVTLTAQ
jgi:beta-lactamase regulating signal transducer with metallopeptidase domain